MVARRRARRASPGLLDAFFLARRRRSEQPIDVPSNDSIAGASSLLELFAFDFAPVGAQKASSLKLGCGLRYFEPSLVRAHAFYTGRRRFKPVARAREMIFRAGHSTARECEMIWRCHNRTSRSFGCAHSVSAVGDRLRKS